MGGGVDAAQRIARSEYKVVCHTLPMAEAIAGSVPPAPSRVDRGSVWVAHIALLCTCHQRRKREL
jgi:hypothetical protein